MKPLLPSILFLLINCNPSTDSVQNENLPLEKGYAQVGDLKMYYEIHGAGKMPLVLIHGGGSTIESNFGLILPMLARNRKVIAVELQAHGRTGDRSTGVTFEQDADDVAGLLAYLKIPKADFLGFSNGGNTAMQIGIRHPEIVNKLILASSFYKRAGMTPGFFDGMANASLDMMPVPLKEAYLAVAPDKDHLQVMHDKDRDRMIQFKDWSEDTLRGLKGPALIILGDHDVVLPEHAAEMSRLIPNSELMILPGNHGSYIGEVCSIREGSRMPELTITVIEEFLDK